MVKVAQRTDRAAQTGEFFSVNEWYFHVQNMKDLVKCIQSSTIDGKPPPYNVDITTLNWDNYVQQYMLGIRQHILKDGPESLSKARSKLNKWELIFFLSLFSKWTVINNLFFWDRLYWIQRVAQAFTIYMVARMLAKISGRWRMILSIQLFIKKCLISLLPDCESSSARDMFHILHSHLIHNF